MLKVKENVNVATLVLKSAAKRSRSIQSLNESICLSRRMVAQHLLMCGTDTGGSCDLLRRTRAKSYEHRKACS